MQNTNYPMSMVTGKREKMSKSKGNVVTVDEVIYGIVEIQSGYIFRDMNWDIVDHKKLGVWRNMSGDGYYYTASRYGKQPVFLCSINDVKEDIPQLTVPGGVIDQHGLISL